MNSELYIAKHILPYKNKANISKPIVRIAVFAIALGLAVMITAVSIIIGFKSTISEKMFGFSSHIQIVNVESGSSFETAPINKDSVLFNEINKQDFISHIQEFTQKPGIIKANNTVKGVVVKGVPQNYNWDFIEKHLVEGSVFELPDTLTNKVVISKQLARLLQLKISDSFITTFVPNESGKKPRKRRFEISGIYETHLQEIDEMFIVADMRHIQNLNYWKSNQISGYEIFLQDYKDIDAQKGKIQDIVGYDITPNQEIKSVQSLKDINPQIFDWLQLLDMNAWVIIALMILVAGMNMITGLLVIILEKTNMIGILKTLGAGNNSVQKIFLYVGGILISRGLLWGNIIGLGLCFLQMQFQIIPLDPETYFMPYVPVHISILSILALNVGTLIITFAMLLLPALIISKISPAEAVKFE